MAPRTCTAACAIAAVVQAEAGGASLSFWPANEPVKAVSDVVARLISAAFPPPSSTLAGGELLDPEGATARLAVFRTA